MSNTAALVSALKTAQAGDTVQLASGTYTPIALTGLHFATDVTITSQDPNHQAVLTGLNVKTSSGLTFSNLEVAVSGPTSTVGVTVSSAVLSQCVRGRVAR